MPANAAAAAAADTSATRARLLNLGLLVGSILLTGVALELAARWLRPPRAEGGLYLYTEHDPVLGWRKRPGARVRFRMPEYTLDVSINRHGLRDPERDYARPPGLCRILALGDSFTEAFTVSQDEGVTQRLESRLTAAGRHTEVINGGTGGYSTDQEYLFYKNEGCRYQPDIVVLLFFYNDIGANASQQKTKPRFVLEDDHLTLTNVPVPPRAWPKAPPEDREAVRGSAALAWIAGRLRTGAPRSYNAIAKLGLWDPIEPGRTRSDFRVYQRRDTPEVDEAWRLTEALLAALRDAVRADGARFAVIYIPNKIEVNDRDWEQTSLKYGWEPEKVVRGRVQRRLQRIGERLEVPVLDLTPALAAADRGLLGGPYFREDMHWNARGHDTAASAIAQFLSQHGWLSTCGEAPSHVR
jgi:lysophospholipase L1-like esterase